MADIRVVITKVGVISPMGHGAQAFAQSLGKGASCLGPLALFTVPEGEPQAYGGEIWSFDPQTILGKKGLRNLDRNSLIVLSCIEKDLIAEVHASGHAEEVALVLGTTFGSLSSQVEFTATYLKEGFHALNPMHFPNLVINSPASQGNIRFGLSHSSTTIANGFTAGLDALVYGADMIRSGQTNMVLAGGSEELSLPLHMGFALDGVLSPSHSLRPFDQGRDGFLLGEGAAMMILESLESAQARKATILAELIGQTSTFQTQDPASPNPEGQIRAMEGALKEAGVKPHDLAFVAASANGSPRGDALEAQALEAVLKKAPVPIVAYKGYYGEAYGASGALAVAAALTDMQEGRVSPTPGFAQAEEDCPLAITRETMAQKPGPILINAFGCTGSCTSVVLQRPKDQ